MGLAESQRLLARVWTDRALRDRFLLDPAQVAADFGLDTAEAEGLAAVAARPLASFADSLVVKRRREVEKLLPLTCRVLEPGCLATLFRRHAEDYVPAGAKRHRDDALAFAAFLERLGRTEPFGPSWLRELLRFEAGVLAATDRSFRRSLHLYRHHPADLVALASHAAPPPSLPLRPTLVLHFRATPQSQLRTVVLGWAFTGRG